MSKKRTWCFVQKPTVFGITCDICGGSNIHWSEFEKLIWCYECKSDTKGTPGIFDGPIPVGVSALLGISFDKLNLITGEILKFERKGDSFIDSPTGKFVPVTQFQGTKMKFLTTQNKPQKHPKNKQKRP